MLIDRSTYSMIPRLIIERGIGAKILTIKIRKLNKTINKTHKYFNHYISQC